MKGEWRARRGVGGGVHKEIEVRSVFYGFLQWSCGIEYYLFVVDGRLNNNERR